MANEIFEPKALANIVRVELVTEETTPKTYRLTDVATEATVEAFIFEGNNVELRVKNKIIAQNETEDILKGFNITMTNATFIHEVLALIDGGTVTYDDTDTDKAISYEAPVAGTAVNRTHFTTKIYTAEKDYDGENLGYTCFEYKHCKGKPVSYSMVDGQFFTPQLAFRSKPKYGESPVKIDDMAELPA